MEDAEGNHLLLDSIIYRYSLSQMRMMAVEKDTTNPVTPPAKPKSVPGSETSFGNMICAWCGKIIRKLNWDSGGMDSHGCCLECKAKAFPSSQPPDQHTNS